MIIHGNIRFIETPFENEDEIENVVFDNYEYLFGSSSFLLPKKLIKTVDGAGTIPDGFAIDLANKKWYIVEAELIKHSVWNHIAPQVSKQIIAAQQIISKKLLIEIAVNQYTENDGIKEKFFDENISEINIRKVLDEILSSEPIVGIPIDKISEDLKEWARTLKLIVKLWTIKKFVDIDNQENILYEFPEEYKPDIDTENIDLCETNRQVTIYEVSINDLIIAGLLRPGETIEMLYAPKTGMKKILKDDKQLFKGIIENDGSISVNDKKFNSPSYAALYCINHAGSPRKTVNGWTSWKTNNNLTLSQLRENYLNLKKNSNSQ